MFFDLLQILFAETPTSEPDSGGTSEPASSSTDKGTPAQGGASSDVMQLSKKEYADLVSAKGLLSSIHSQRDKERQQYEQNIQLLQAEVDRVKTPSQPSALEQILAGASNTTDASNDSFIDDVANVNVGFIKQVAQALQTDINTKLSAYNTEMQSLKEELKNSKTENILASRTLQRRANIDAAMNDKIAKLQSEYHISRQEAADFISAREKAIDTLQQLPQVDDAEIGGLYSLVDDIIDGVADRKNKLALHKAEIEKAETDEKAKIKALLEGDKTPDRTKIVLDLNKEKSVEDHDLTPIAKGESREEYAYRQIQEQLDKSLAKKKQFLSSAGFK